MIDLNYVKTLFDEDMVEAVDDTLPVNMTSPVINKGDILFFKQYDIIRLGGGERIVYINLRHTNGIPLWYLAEHFKPAMNADVPDDKFWLG